MPRESKRHYEDGCCRFDSTIFNTTTKPKEVTCKKCREWLLKLAQRIKAASTLWVRHG